jgi:hypothetical protein
MKLLSSLVLCVACLSTCLPLSAQFVRAKGREFVDAKGQVLHLKGTNLGNWMVPEGYMWRLDGAQSPREIEALTETLLGPEKAEAFWKEYRERYITESDIDFLARSGFNVLRVPMHYKFFNSEQGEGFRLLDRLVGWSRKAGLHLILDMHCAPGGQTGTNIDDSRGYPWLFESPRAQAQLAETWCRIARHYRDEPVILGFDLMNEPIPHYPQLAKLNTALEPLYRRLVREIRAVDPNHVLILTGAQWGTNFKVLGPPFAENLAYTFHRYWMPPTLECIQEYLDFRDRYNVPMWMGESGENKDEWVAAFRKLLDEQQVGWTFWPYKKMDGESGIAQFKRPIHWDAIAAFAKAPTGTGQAEKTLAVRPAQILIEESFADLLEQIRFANIQPNLGYIKALGMVPPKAAGSTVP